MTLEAYEQAIENTVFLRIVSCDDKGAKGGYYQKRNIRGSKRVKDAGKVSTNIQQRT
jgi:hypothetical protein